MRVWLITVGEPLPSDVGSGRLLRTGLLAHLMAGQGHEVTWWNSTLEHVSKKQRYDTDTTLQIVDRLKVILLHAPGYQKNVSLQRLRNHRGIARKFRALAPQEPVPDVILCSLPTLELCEEAIAYGRKQNIPVAIDVRDLWPDIFLDFAPRAAKGVVRALLAPMFRSAHRVCSQCSAVLGITPAIVDWGLRYAGRAKTQWDRDFPLAYMQKTPSEEDRVKGEAFWREQGLDRESGAFLVCFFGNIGNQFEMEPVLEAARRLNGGPRDIRVVICGNGDKLPDYQAQAAGCANVLFPGWIGTAEVWTLLRLSALGIAPYVNRHDFAASLPNKSIEYLSAGLPVLTGLQTGVLKELLETEGCGFAYRDAAHLEQTLIDLYDHRDRLLAAADNAQRVFDARFVGERVYADMSAYLGELADCGPHVRDG